MDVRDKKTEKTLLRFTTTGSVDDGKSSLIGRLLFETNCIFEDQYASLEKSSLKRGAQEVDLAHLLDGLSSEREQGITIDVAYRYFETTKRKFIIADTPGHEQYTRNMITGASTAELAIILIDARNGVLTQSKRHGFLVSLLQVPHLIVAVNKMDLVDYSQEVYDKVVQDYTDFARKLDIHDITFIPVSALKGDNVTSSSENMPWYDGQTLLHLLENIQVESDKNFVDFRFPVQYVSRPHLNFRGYAGTVISGTVSPGEEIIVLPSGKKSKVKSIETCDGSQDEAFAGQAVTLTTEEELDISRGDMIVRKNNLPEVENNFEATLCWMDEDPLDLKTSYILKQTTQSVKAFITELTYQIDVNTLHREDADTLRLNEIGRASLRTAKPIFFDPYEINPPNGAFILIHPDTNRTVAGGMIRNIRRTSENITRKVESARTSENVFWESGLIPRDKWEEINGHKAGVIWLTGYSGSGKTTVAKSLVQNLFNRNTRVMMLDGDNVRHGLCRDLGFSSDDRSENIRRVGEAAKLFFDQGNIVVCTFISPFREDRDFVRSLFPSGSFIETYVKCDLNICRKRDPKGLYGKAESGIIPEFTGVTSPYEEPETPEIIVETDIMTDSECVEKIMEKIVPDFL